MSLSEAATAAQLSIPFIFQMCSLKTVVCITVAMWLCYLQLKMVDKGNMTSLHEQVWHAVSFCELLMVLSRFTDCISTY